MEMEEVRMNASHEAGRTTEYPKIQTVFLRDPVTKYRTLLEGQYALPEFEYLADCRWEFTEKVDGTNVRVIVDAEGRAEFRGKTDAAQLPARLVEWLRLEFDDDVRREQLHAVLPDGGVLYGEGYGAGIQKGGGNYISDGQAFVLFDVRVGYWWLRRLGVDDVAYKLGLLTVPVIGYGPLELMVRYCRLGFESTWGGFPAEGIVARPMVEFCTRAGHRVITKLKCKDFVAP